MRREEILFTVVLIFAAVFFSKISSATIPPHPILTTSISPPPNSGTPEKILEIAFSINSTNQITLQSSEIKNLSPTIINPTSSDFYLEITDSNNQQLFKSNILVVYNSQNISPEYYAIPYPNGAKYLYFFYQGNQIARYDVPQEFPWLYVIIGIIAAIVLIILYYISKNYTIQI
jgi:hypothetical protein